MGFGPLLIYCIKPCRNGQADGLLAARNAWALATLTRMSKEGGARNANTGAERGERTGGFIQKEEKSNGQADGLLAARNAWALATLTRMSKEGGARNANTGGGARGAHRGALYRQ